jgi:hypothetical protein
MIWLHSVAFKSIHQSSHPFNPMNKELIKLLQYYLSKAIKLSRGKRKAV